MSTSEAVGRAVHEAIVNGHDWETIECTWDFDDLSESDRAVWVKIGMAAVKAYDAARWREPTELDIRDHENPRWMTISYMRAEGEWSPWSEVEKTRYVCTPTNCTRVLVADPLPLPELPG